MKSSTSEMAVSAQVQLKDPDTGEPSVRMFFQPEGYDYDEGTDMAELKRHFLPIMDVLLPPIVDGNTVGWTRLRFYRKDGTVLLDATDEHPLPAGTVDTMNDQWANGDELFMKAIQRHVFELVAALGMSIAMERQSEGALTAAAFLSKMLGGLSPETGTTYGVTDGVLRQLNEKEPHTIN